jgi:hypothetical protein
LPFELTVIEGVIVDIVDDNDDSDLQGNGVLSWVDVDPGSTVSGDFSIENVGLPGSEIDWEIITWPEWGEWTFTPASGDGLTPEDGPVTIQVSVVAPEDPDEEFNGYIKIVNVDDSSDSCLIHVSLVTPQNTSLIELLVQNYIQKTLPCFQLLRCVCGK